MKKILLLLLFCSSVLAQVQPPNGGGGSGTPVPPSGDTTGVKDTANINAVLATGGNVSLQNGHYYTTGGLTVDISKQSFFGNGAILDCTPMSSGSTCVTETATVGGVNHDAQHERFTISQLDIIGNAVGTGLVWNAASEPAVAYTNMVGVVVENFATCAQVGNNVYDVDLYAVVFNLCGTQSLYIPNGISDSFERLAMHGGAITNSVIGVNNLEAAGQVFLDGVSLTFDGIFITTNNGSRVYCKNCHFETAVGSTTNSWVQAEGGVGNIVTIDGGSMIADGSPPGGWPSIFDIASGSQIILSGGTLLNQTENTGNALVTGTGTLYVYPPIPTFGGSNAPITGSNIVTMASLNSPTFLGNVTFTGQQLCTDNTSIPCYYAGGSNPAYGWKQTGAATDQAIWDAIYSGTTLTFRGVNDVYSAANTWLAVGRGSGYTIGSLTFGANNSPYTFTGNGAFTLPTLTTGTNADFLCVTSGFVVVIQSTACTISSKQFKENIVDFKSDILTVISQLEVASFNMKPSDVPNADPNFGSRQTGLIAENITQVFPQCAIYENDMKTPKSYRQECMIALLVRGEQELMQQNRLLKTRLERIEHPRQLRVRNVH